MDESYRYIGKATPRIDALDVVRGAATYLDDIKFGGLLHGKVLRSPHPHALIKRIHKGKAEALNGVWAILTWEDVPGWKAGTPRVFQVLSQKVRYVGDAVALVAAETEEVARDALRLIDVEYEILPAVYDIEKALLPGAPQLYDEFPGNMLPTGDRNLGPKGLTGIVKGDVNRGFSEADFIAEGTVNYDNVPNPVPIESPGAVALWEDPNKVTVWVSTQAPHLTKMILSGIIGRGTTVRTIGCTCGGSFGSKAMSWQLQCYAILLSRATRRHVKVIFTKEEHLATFVLRPESRIYGKVGMKKDGTVTAIEGNWLVGTGYYSDTTQSQIAVGCGEAQIAVRCANWDFKPVIVCTNRSSSGIVRGFGGQELKCCLLPLLSLAMQKGGLDPYEVLKKNFIKPGEGYFWRDGNWYTYRGVDFSEAMERGAKQFGWKDKWNGWLNPSSMDGSKRRGVGVGIHGNADVGEDVSEAWVRINPDGKVTIHCSLAEHGTGQRTSCAKAVAEVLGIPMESVAFTPTDSLLNPFEFGAFGSRGSYAILSAIIDAAEDAKRKLFVHAAAMLKADADDLQTEDEVIWLKGFPERRIEWRKVLRLRTVLGAGRFEPDYSLSNCIMSFVEVEVDTDSGKVTLLNIVNATDVGRIINPHGLEGQLNGCLGSAGVDSALFEEMILDQSTGHLLNANMCDYKWRTSLKLPPINNVVLETSFPTHRFHAIGVGEIATAPGTSAVLMAVSNAIGIWLHDYPTTPERILKALGKVNIKNKRKLV
ncbi:MAG: xanthine dehydrogenase family protein molybdopterin-binding subunit [Desulfobacteraceae bacterium]|nr:MAG: xanthine dehydrogenase family protein molybdopterin-binding subunit [Desulfobacteraceae bacterium]